MKIALDINPIDENSDSNHKIRGVGKYISLLKDNLEKFDKKNSYVFTSDPNQVDADIIHYPYFDPFFVTLPKKNRIKTVVTVHDVIPITHSQHFPSGIKGRIKWFINRARLQKVDSIITDSKASKEELMKVAKIPSSRIFPIHLAVDKDFRKREILPKEEKEFKSKFNLPGKFFLYVGDVTWNKNLPKLVNAVKRGGTPLVMVGKAIADDDYDRNNPWNNDRLIIENLAKDKNLFVKLGFVTTEDLVTLYNLAIALCMPSLDEGFGLPVLESMSSGCPVITSDRGSLPEVGGDAVLYVDPNDEDDIARVLQTISSDENLRADYAKRGLVQADKFSLEKLALDTIRVYEKTHQNISK